MEEDTFSKSLGYQKLRNPNLKGAFTCFQIRKAFVIHERENVVGTIDRKRKWLNMVIVVFAVFLWQVLDAPGLNTAALARLHLLQFSCGKGWVLMA